MKTKAIFSVLKLTFIASLLFSLAPATAARGASSGQDQPGAGMISESAAQTNGIVLVVNKLIDLKWNPAQYPASPGRFKRWELYRGTTPDAPFKITSGTDQTTGFYRDRSIADDGTYYYRLVVVRCKDPCLTGDDEVLLTFFTDSITTGVFSGYLYRSLELLEGTYPIGFSSISSTAAVFVEDGASLSVSKNAKLTKTPDISHGGLMVHSGSVSVKGTSLSSILLTLGEYGGIEADCTATLDTVAFTNSNLNINAACQLNVEGGGGTFTVFATDASKATIQKAYIEGSVEIDKQAVGTLSNNHMIGKVAIDGSYAAATPKAQGYLHANVISTPYHTQVVTAGGGALVQLTENTFSYTGIVDTESAVLVFASDDGTKLVARSNRVENGKIFMGWNPNVEITDNVLVGNGSAITVGCPFCGTAQQASGSIELNTLQSGWGFEMWDGSQFLILKHNCIRGNNPGLTVVNTLPVNLNVQENYWGAANGPRHPTNPGGSGDEIVGAKVDFSNWDTTDANCREAPPPAVPDLTPIGMEVVQTVQTMDNSVPLAAERTTIARLYAQSTRGTVTDVTAELRGYRGDTLLGTLAPVERIAVKPLTPIIQLRIEGKGSWVFWLPKAWTAAGDLRLVAAINQDNAVTELNTSNNGLERTVSFTPRRTLRVALVPIRYHTLLTDDTPTQGQLQAMTWMIRSMYPLSNVQIEIIPSPMEWTIPLLTEAFQGNVTSIIMNRLYARLDLFNQNRAADRKIDQIFGVFPYAANLSFCTSDPRWISGKGKAAYCNPWVAGLPHEIGHNLGLRHPNTPDSCGSQDPQTDWPFNNATINEVGVDIRGRNFMGPGTHDIMSYCKVTQWISPFHATKLFNSDGFPQPTNRTEVATTYLFARGQVTATGEVTLLPAWQLSTSTPPENPPQGSTYCLQLQNSGGGLLSSYCFDPQLIEHETGIARDTSEFEIALPISGSAARLVVTRDGSVAAQSDASAAAPAVTLTYPNGGETLSGSFTVEWTASDADGDDLFYHLLYSADDGLTWTPLAEYLTDQEYSLDTSVLAGSEGGRLRVMASDGFHTAQDDSDGVFITPDNPPQAGIGTPLDGESGVLPLRLAGAGYDLEDGELPGESLVWESDIDGNLGSGMDLLLEELTIGTHHITLTVTDSQGQSGSTSIQYTVKPQPLIFLPAIFR